MKRLWLKILILLSIGNFALILLLSWVFTWSFEQAFSSYLKDLERERFQPFLDAAIVEYQNYGQNWDWVRSERGIWKSLLKQHLLPKHAGRSKQGEDRPEHWHDRPYDHPHEHSHDKTSDNRGPRIASDDGDVSDSSGSDKAFERSDQSSSSKRARRIPPRPTRPPTSPEGFNPFVILYDEAGSMVIGKVKADDSIYRFPIMFQGRQIGTLGVMEDKNLRTAMKAVMAKQNDSRIAIIVISLVVLSVFSALILSTVATRRIYNIKAGTHALVRGQFTHEISAKGKDAIDDLARDVNNLARTLEENRTSQKRLIASTSHELRTPVTILRGQIDALRDGIREATPDYLDSLAQDIDRLNDLIDDLHQLSMSDLGALNYCKDEIDLQELMTDELDKARSMLPSGMALDWQPSQDAEFYLLGDGLRLAQLIKNLLQNSIRYTDEPGMIRVRMRSVGDSLILTWEDSSPGVALNEQDKLLQPLYRTEQSRSRKNAGSGLGLAIVKTIVQAHGGDIVPVSSSLGGLRWIISFKKLQ